MLENYHMLFFVSLYAVLVTYKWFKSAVKNKKQELSLEELHRKYNRQMMEILELATVDQLLTEMLKRSYAKLIMISPMKNNDKDSLQIHSNLGKDVISKILYVAKNLVDQEINPTKESGD